jgi:hypothetical protein
MGAVEPASTELLYKIIFSAESKDLLLDDHCRPRKPS